MTALLRIVCSGLLLALLSSAPSFAQEEDERGRRGRAPKEPEVIYINFDPVTVSVRGESRVEGLISIRYALEVIGDDKAEYVRAQKPRLASTIVMYLTRYGNIGINPKKKVNVAVLDTIMQRAVDSVLVDTKTDVLVLEVNSRPL